MVVCRHGVVHMRWENLTLRMEIEEFRRLAHLVERVGGARPPFSLADRELSLATDDVYAGREQAYRVAFGAVELSLPADGWSAFQILIQDAAYRLDQVTAREDWQQEPEPVALSPDAGDPDRPHPFSLN
jgi:hypothetical protein